VKKPIVKELEDALDPAHDPYPEAASRLSRRSLALVPAVILAACRAPRDLVCAPQEKDRERCTARFCRYHAG
jgi:hypothetical protein